MCALKGNYFLIENSIGEVISSTYQRLEFELYRDSIMQSIERGTFVVVSNGGSLLVGVVTGTKLVVVGTGSTRPSRLKIGPEEIDRTLPELKDRVYNSYEAVIVGEFFDGKFVHASNLHHAIVHAQVYKMHPDDVRDFLKIPCDYLHLIYSEDGVEAVLSHLRNVKMLLSENEFFDFLKGAVRMLHVRGEDELIRLVVSIIE